VDPRDNYPRNIGVYQGFFYNMIVRSRVSFAPMGWMKIVKETFPLVHGVELST
jgi:hypothetical protein